MYNFFIIKVSFAGVGPLYKKITISEVARLANVSTATVSRALNDSPSVKESTKKKIVSIANDLEARNSGGRKSSKMLLASFPELTNPFYSDVFRGILEAAGNRGYNVLFYAMSDYSLPESYSFFYENTFYDGLIIAHALPNAQVQQQLQSLAPVVMVSEYSDSDTCYVAIDNQKAAYTAVHYLLCSGRRKIALINSSLRNNYAARREQAYRACLANHGMKVNEDWVIHLSDINYGTCLDASTRLLGQEDRPDAIFCVSDVYAAAATKAASELGLKIPKELAVVGFDNIDLSTMTTPAITTIAQPTFQLGAQACSMLIDRIEYPATAPRRILLDGELILRGTT